MLDKEQSAEQQRNECQLQNEYIHIVPLKDGGVACGVKYLAPFLCSFADER